MSKSTNRPVNRKATSNGWRVVSSIFGTALMLFVIVGSDAIRPLTSVALAQQDIHEGHAAGQTFEPLLDGSQEPDAIPDHVAIRALMQTLRIPANPNAAAVDRLHARVNRVNLSDDDMEVLVNQLGAFDAPAKDQQARIEAVRPSSAEANAAAIARYVEEQKKFDSLIVEYYQQLLASLSPEGAEKLQAHLRHVKSRIKIYPTPDMSSSVK